MDSADGVLRHLLRVWAKEYTRLCLGGIKFNDGTWHVDGYSRVSINGKLKDAESGGNSHVSVRQHFAELYSRDALLIRQAMVGMRPHLIIVIQYHYLIPPPVERRAEAIGISKPRYYERLALAHGYLQGRIDAELTPAHHR
jgi:hypothetical protein